MSGYQSISQRKEEYRKYLESNGVVDAITKVIVSLYEQEVKPEDPLQYVWTMNVDRFQGISNNFKFLLAYIMFLSCFYVYNLELIMFTFSNSNFGICSTLNFNITFNL